MMEGLRGDPPRPSAGSRSLSSKTCATRTDGWAPCKAATDAAGRNVLIFRLGDVGSVVLRPSGTEPKAKAYIEMASAPRATGASDATWKTNCAEIDSVTRLVAEDFLARSLALVSQKPSGPIRLSR